MFRKINSNAKTLYHADASRLLSILQIVVLLILSVGASRSDAQEAQWIWTPEHPGRQAAAGDCYFRKTIQLGAIEQASVTITADDQYELYVNGRRIGAGNSIRQMEQYDITRLLGRGRNVIGVKVTNLNSGPAALAARVFVKPAGGQWLAYSTDKSWRTSIDTVPTWQSNAYTDASWKPAQVFGALGETAPWDRREGVSPERLSENSRFRISQEFAVDEVLGDEITGSLVNIAFNEFGHIIAAQEGGPLLLIYDSDKDGTVDKTREYCDSIDNIQGILPLNGDVYVTGDGPDGSGVYRLVDEDRNGALEEATKIVGFQGQSGEHGAHGLTLGPDGKIYCVLGNHVQYAGEYASTSPLKNVYEGDLVGPRYEDPGGHAQGIKAPGGTVVRFDIKGESVELVAGGLRNAFDLAFAPDGQLFVHDSDMESDEGSVWYRPTSLYEIAEGGEYGWRSGWAKWPSYYYDRLPTVLETGRGSPTGACVYDHFMFPARYKGCLFLADWTAGQIKCITFKDGQPQADVFIEGQPLNVTDLTVGPDGWLYFCTGGRGTKGGIYQVRWLGTVPTAVSDLGNGIARAIKQPQLDAAWARQRVATLKRELGASWGDTVAGVAFSDDNSSKYRLRALDLMQLFGPAPTPELLVALSKTPNEAVRARAARLLGAHTENEEANNKLVSLLSDSESSVQLAAAESLLKYEGATQVEPLLPLLQSQNRRVSWAARRLLERIPTEQWQSKLLTDADQRVRLQAGLALMIADPSPAAARAVLSMSRQLLSEFVSDRNFVDLLRLVQVTLHRSGLKADELPELKNALVAEYPVGEPLLNRELIRLLAYLQADEIVPAALSSLQSDLPLAERMHTAMHLRFFDHQWTAAERFSVIKFFEETQLVDSGSSVPLYVMNVTRDLCSDLPMEEARIFVSEGAKWPNAALVSLYQYPETLSESDLSTLKKLDEEIDRKGFESEEYKRLRTGIVALLTQHGDEEAMAYLREIWVRSPERRQAVALGLSMKPNDENWDYLVRSLPVLESFAVSEVMNALRRVAAATDDPHAIREVILHGLRMQEEGSNPVAATRLLSYWTGVDFTGEQASTKSPMAPWQTWFAEKYPNSQEAVLPELEESSPWNLDTLNEFFASSDGRKGDATHGQEIYEQAQCAKCHRMGSVGTSVGPDLTSVSSRFTRREVLESVLYPSHIISDQYRTKRVLTVDGKILTGSVVQNADGTITVRDSKLDEHIVAEQDIELIEPSKSSLMPSGLVDNFSAADIRDMMTYLGFVAPQQVAERSVPNVSR